MVEGGGTVHTQFLTAGLADEIQLVIAPSWSATPPPPASSAPATSPKDPPTAWPSPKYARSATSSSPATSPQEYSRGGC
ncbi:MAG TPA: dihydrofolate reductase family protein [Actinomadura sp.]|nr:dihydrofolate reductase family protein [Actinomadura sp.]